MPGLAVHWDSPLARHVSYLNRPEYFFRIC